MVLLALGVGAAAQAATFTSSSLVTINEPGAAPNKASLYPTTINVSTVITSASSVTITLNGLSHARPIDLDMILVSPAGRSIKFLSDVGGSSSSGTVTLTFDDNASSTIPSNVMFSGTYRPSVDFTSETLPSPAPFSTTGTTMSTFSGYDPNGLWRLYISDDTIGSTGSLNGWSLTINASPANDNLASAAVLASALITGTNIGATSEIGEPRGVGIARASVWWDWTAPSTADFVFETSATSIDTVLGIYTGSSVGALTQVAFNDDRAAVGGPSGLILSATSGTVYHIQVDGYGSADVGTFDLTVSVPTTPTVTSPTTASGTVGTAMTYQITASNYPTSYSASGLPPGFTVNTTTGAISGTPTAAGTFVVTIGAANSAGNGPGSVTLTIGLSPPTITSSASAAGALGAAFSYDITATNTPTGFAAGSLPPGLSVNTATGRISGTPTKSGTWTSGIFATNTGGTASKALTITVGGAPVAAASSSDDSGSCGLGSGLGVLLLAFLMRTRVSRR